MRPRLAWLHGNAVSNLAVVIVAIVAVVAMIRRDRMSASFQHRTQPVSAGVKLEAGEWREVLALGRGVGSRNAPLVIATFFDVECPYCRRLHSELREWQRATRSRATLLFVHFPLTRHQYGRIGARVLECAHQQGRFDRLLDVVFAVQDSLSAVSWTNLARTAGVRDLDAFERCRRLTSPVQHVEQSVELGRRMGVPGTPTMIVNGFMYKGAISTAELNRAITAAGKASSGYPVEGGARVTPTERR